MCNKNPSDPNVTFLLPGNTHERNILHSYTGYHCVTHFKSLFFFFTVPPEISLERQIVHSGEGFEAQLVCIVHGESQPEVRLKQM